MQKGPWLYFNKEWKTVRIRSKTSTFTGYDYMIAEIYVGESGVTFVFKDRKLVKKLDYIDKRVLDWILPQLPEYIDSEDRPIQFLKT